MIDFTKMHGLGNDFVIINKDNINENMNLSEFARAISDRHTGVGCDQLIIYATIDDDSHNQICDASYEMIIYNQDGSRAEACGNGARCLTRFVGHKRSLIVAGDRLLKSELYENGDAMVNMGLACFHEAWMPSDVDLWELANFYSLDPREIICVSMGNPHLVIFKDNLTEADKTLIGREIECHRLFKNGVNVNFATILSRDEMSLTVWERGDGFTLACGSGACASYAAARKLGFVGNECKVTFKLGSLAMSSSDDGIWMRGPTSIVALGKYLHTKG